MFERSIRVAIEHGQADARSEDWPSTAYSYQAEPHKPFRQVAGAAWRPSGEPRPRAARGP